MWGRIFWSNHSLFITYSTKDIMKSVHGSIFLLLPNPCCLYTANIRLWKSSWVREGKICSKGNSNDNFFICPVKRRSHFYWLAGLSYQSMVFPWHHKSPNPLLNCELSELWGCGRGDEGKYPIKPLPAFICCCSWSCKSINEIPTPSYELDSPYWDLCPSS